MRNLIVKHLVIVFFVFILSGCLGVVTLSSKESGYRTYWQDDLGKIGIETSRAESSIIGEKVEYLINVMGKPDKIEKDNGGETWIYYGDKKRLWQGIVPIVVLLPIPLVIPTGYQYIEIKTVNGEVGSYTFLEEVSHARACGPLVLGPAFHVLFGPGCINEEI